MKYTVKNIVRKYLVVHGFDGLCNTEISCGCKLEDLFPCGECHLDCQAGYLKQYKANDECQCDGCGTDHWHIDPPDPMKNASDWKCDCGDRCDPSSPEWRWNGEAWQHQHGYPIGHVSAFYEPEKGEK